MDLNQSPVNMQPLPILYPSTLVWRHRRENLKKCSLRGLETRPDFRFYTYPQADLPSLEKHLVLSIDAPPLSIEDKEYGLVIVDATWRYAERMLCRIETMPHLLKRSIPQDFRTAYPRRQEDCEDPERGLASIEALFVAYHLLRRDTAGLLDHYHWKEAFLQKNQFLKDEN